MIIFQRPFLNNFNFELLVNMNGLLEMIPIFIDFIIKYYNFAKIVEIFKYLI